MKDEVLEKMVGIYNRKSEIQNEYFDCISRLRELRTDEKVCEYLKLLNHVDYTTLIYSDIYKWTTESLINAAFNQCSNDIDETNGIMVYLGTFRFVAECDNYLRVRYDDPKAELRRYADIEKNISESLQIPIQKCLEYETNHKIIIPSTIMSKQYFYKLQKEFINDAVLINQEKAVSRVLEKTKNNKIRF